MISYDVYSLIRYFTLNKLKQILKHATTINKTNYYFVVRGFQLMQRSIPI